MSAFGRCMLIPVRAVLRLIGALSALTVIATAVFISQFGLVGLSRLVATGAFGVVTLLGWVVTFVAGPIAAIQLFRLRNTGRVAAAILWGSMLLYYLTGAVFFREPGVLLRPIILLCVPCAVLLGIVLSPAARNTCTANATAKVLMS